MGSCFSFRADEPIFEYEAAFLLLTPPPYICAQHCGSKAENPACSALQRRSEVGSNRAMPEWGKSIFSEYCIMMRPDTDEALEAFMRYSVALFRLHLRFAHASEPVQLSE